MKKSSKYDIEYNEFYLLGAFFFAALFLLYCLNENMLSGAAKVVNDQISMPQQTIRKINRNFDNNQDPRLPQMSIINDNETRFDLNDDIIMYNSSFYSITLPYNLTYYTDKYGAAKSSEQLLEAQKQVFEQAVKNGLLDSSSAVVADNLINNLNELIKKEKLIYSFLRNTNCKNVAIKKNIYNVIEKIDPEHGNIFVLIARNEQELENIFNKKELQASYEAIIIIKIINEHMFILAEKVRSDYYFTILNHQ
ncbi:MAG: hypothetical protein AB1782_17070, partial [Cyanobacteriota bacterium]